jgi:hypothetical protein
MSLRVFDSEKPPVEPLQSIEIDGVVVGDVTPRDYGHGRRWHTVIRSIDGQRSVPWLIQGHGETVRESLEEGLQSAREQVAAMQEAIQRIESAIADDSQSQAS